jgi:hypothetical protein
MQPPILFVRGEHLIAFYSQALRCGKVTLASEFG